MLLRVHNIVSEAAASEGRTIAALDIVPRSVASILPSYLWRYRPAGQFTKRTEA
jgi:NADH dehydrogenase